MEEVRAAAACSFHPLSLSHPFPSAGGKKKRNRRRFHVPTFLLRDLHLHSIRLARLEPVTSPSRRALHLLYAVRISCLKPQAHSKNPLIPSCLVSSRFVLVFCAFSWLSHTHSGCMDSLGRFSFFSFFTIVSVSHSGYLKLRIRFESAINKPCVEAGCFGDFFVFFPFLLFPFLSFFCFFAFMLI